MSLVLNALLSRYGFRLALCTIACAMVILVAPLLVFVKPRLPVPAASTAGPIDISFLKRPLFWVLQSFNIVQGTGYFLPPNYLPSYSKILRTQCAVWVAAHCHGKCSLSDGFLSSWTSYGSLEC
jgi:hypothetical protein